MNIEEKLFNSVKNNNIKNVKFILNDKSITLPEDFNINSSLRLAIEYGYSDIVKTFLNDGRIKPCSSSIPLFYLAVKFNQFDIVKILLDDKRLDPSKDSNMFIISAYENGYSGIVNLLWQDQRVKSSLKDVCFELYDELIQKDKIKEKIEDF